MKETNIYIKVRPYGGSYIARVYEPKMKVQASCTCSARDAARRCAVKAGGREPLRIEELGIRDWCHTFRAVFALEGKEPQ